MMRRLLSDRRGVAASEFAMSLPFLVLLYIGGYQLSDAISAYRKVAVATRTMADLTSQYTSVSDDDVNTIMDASAQVLNPYKVSAAKITISQIAISSSGVATVDWSFGKNITKLTKGTPFTLPASVRTPNSYVIVASINYTYTPVAASGMIGTIPMQDQIVMGPRSSVEVDCRTCS
jgi:Flp pilus assembly protein TadG